jgi:hypothetical protein
MYDNFYKTRLDVFQWIDIQKTYVYDCAIWLGTRVVWKMVKWGFFDVCANICAMINQYTPSVYFEFISKNGDIINTQYNTCIPVDDYEYVVYTNKQLKSIVSKTDVAQLYNDNHKTFTQKIIKSPFCSVGLNIDPKSDLIDIEFKTDAYNYYLNKNVINRCTLTYFLHKHYPAITLPSNYELTVFTSTCSIKNHKCTETIVFNEE